jgi:hypothetical protein
MAERLTRSSGTILNINCIIVDDPKGKIQDVFCNALSVRGVPGTFKTGIEVKVKIY